MHRSGKHKGILSFLVSLLIAVTAIVLPEGSLSSRAAVLYNKDGTYLSEAFNIAGGNFYRQLFSVRLLSGHTLRRLALFSLSEGR